MTADTPYDWLSRVASATPLRPCLADHAEMLSYGDVLERVDMRAAEVRQGIGVWEIVPFPARIDIDSVIEILAIQKARGVPFPHMGRTPALPVPTSPHTAVCVETSGSSGTRKIVPLTFANVRASVRASRMRLSNGPSDRWQLCLPLNHVGGLSVVWRSLEAGGSAIVAPFDATGATIERFRPTVASMVPTMVQRLLEDNAEALASIGLVLVGGAALGRPIWDRCARAGIRLVPTYGLTEACSQVATAIPDEPDASGGAGKPLDGIDVVIIGSDGANLESGQLGVVTVDGPAVFDGYLGEGSRTGRFRTNDVGRFDVDGNLHIEGRIDDVIMSGGESVSLIRVAGVISEIDGIQEVCVVGVEDSQWGTVGGAMVVSNRGLESFDTMVEEELEPHERPKRWLVRDAIPTLGNGKHDLAAVRKAFEEETWT